MALAGQSYLGRAVPGRPGLRDGHHAGGGEGRQGRSPPRACSAASPSTSSSCGSGDHWQTHAIEINLRKGGTTHPFLTLQFLTDGVYDPRTGRFRTPSGAERHLVATDHLEDEMLRGLGVDDLFDLVARTGLHFDQSRQSGVVFHMISSITECGRVGMTAIGDTPDSAQDVFDRAESALLAEAHASLVPHPLPLRGRLGEGLR